jgi:hypothetical protein
MACDVFLSAGGNKTITWSGQLGRMNLTEKNRRIPRPGTRNRTSEGARELVPRRPLSFHNRSKSALLPRSA